MRIHGHSPLSTGIVPDRSEKTTRTEQPTAANPQDQTSFSSDKVSISSLEARVMQTPEIRQERVASLKDAIRKGEYALDANKIADAMLNESAG
jgi:negative regulator of flagellin synthesis FlgM